MGDTELLVSHNGRDQHGGDGECEANEQSGKDDSKVNEVEIFHRQVNARLGLARSNLGAVSLQRSIDSVLDGEHGVTSTRPCVGTCMGKIWFC